MADADIVSEIDPMSIIIKPPVSVSRGDNYYSEIWYRLQPNEDDSGISGISGIKAIRPIIKVPRLKVIYSARKFQDNGAYGFCVSLYNREIDQEIADFFSLIQRFDAAIKSLYVQQREQPGFFRKNIGNVFHASLCRKTKTHDYYFRTKLIHGKDGAVLTKINKIDRSCGTPEDITYGCFVDQYVNPSYVYYSSAGIRVVWVCHQIVIDDRPQIFLKDCLLDVVAPIIPSTIPSTILVQVPPAPPLPTSPSLPTPVKPHPQYQSKSIKNVFRATIRADELQLIKSRLKPTEIQGEEKEENF